MNINEKKNLLIKAMKDKLKISFDYRNLQGGLSSPTGIPEVLITEEKLKFRMKNEKKTYILDSASNLKICVIESFLSKLLKPLPLLISFLIAIKNFF